MANQPQRQRRICSAARQLIQSFEGLELRSYPDPGSGGAPWTCCWGHTGADVQPNQTYTNSDCERLFSSDLARFEQGVEALLPGLPQHQFCALVSWAFNVGLHAVQGSSLRRRIQAGEPPALVIAQELPRWNKGASGVLAGLNRRRAAEVEHAITADPDTPAVPETASDPAATTTAIALADFFSHYAALPHQRQAIALLQHALQGHPVLEASHAWVQTYRSAPSASADATTIQLSVPYFPQHDSDTAHGDRMCFSSTNAMLLEFLRPGSLTSARSGPHQQPDDLYLSHLLNHHGDTTSAAAQIQALRHWGINARFRTDGTPQHLITQLQRGIPIPIGVLHKGSWQQPTGGGHWLLIVGIDNTTQQWIVHDPAGEMHVRSGGYAPRSATAGRSIRYSFEGLNARWLIEGPASGWFIQADA
jgi:GH24 family phage-related lysozyme (muramidase)